MLPSSSPKLVAQHRTGHQRPLRHLVAGLATVLAAAAVSPGLAVAADPRPSGSEGVVLHEAELTKEGAIRHSSATVKAETFDATATEPKKDEQPNVLTFPGRIDPRLQAMIDSGDPDKRVRVLVTFEEDQQIPRMPDPVVEEPRSSKANQEAQARADAIVEELRARRADGYDKIAGELKDLEAEVAERFWLIKGIVVDLPLRSVKRIAERSDVHYVELDDMGTKPPDANPNNDEDDARALIRTDPYFALGQTTGWIGLLDTGVRASHTLFNAPSHIAFREDMTVPGIGNPDDDCWNHGTSTAAIISGNGNLGNAFRGITAIAVDSFKVYPAGCGGLSGAASVSGFQRAVNVLDRVIVAEMQAGGNEVSAISTAADNAFDAGAVVIAANGNNGSGASTVNVPAVAQKALGIGAVDVQSLATPGYQSRGPAGDGRIKPDIQAPTNVETASSSNNTATRVFGGTSAATPHAAGAAALVRNFLRGGTGSIDPGHVYAYMILSGTRAYPFNNTNGAARIKLPVNGHYWRGSVNVGNGQVIDVPIGVPATNNQLNASIWWPESPASHKDVDLTLVDPGGVERDWSPSAAGVFERASVNGPIAGGTWKLRIRGYNVPGGPQRVYFAATHTTP